MQTNRFRNPVKLFRNTYIWLYSSRICDNYYGILKKTMLLWWLQLIFWLCIFDTITKQTYCWTFMSVIEDPSNSNGWTDGLLKYAPNDESILNNWLTTKRTHQTRDWPTPFKFPRTMHHSKMVICSNSHSRRHLCMHFYFI